MGRIITTFAATLAVGLTVATVASAGVTVPPGNGEADQYSETVPGAGGNVTPGGDADPADVLPPGQARELQQRGGDAAAVAAFSAATAPTEAGGGATGAGAGPGGGSRGDGASSSSPGGEAAARTPLPPDDGLGTGLWIIVAAAAAGAVLFAARRRHVASAG